MKIDLLQFFDDYCIRVGLPKEKMPQVQRVETRRAFMAGMASMTAIMRDVVGAIDDEEEAVKVMEEINRQILHFWSNEKNPTNGSSSQTGTKPTGN